MIGRAVALILLVGSSLVLTGCGPAEHHQDLKDFLEDVKAQPNRAIEPLPQFTTYEAYTYSATGYRSPFQAPIKVEIVRKTRVVSDIKPDKDRVKQFLENYSFDSFSMVGTLSDDNGFWALLSANGSVYRVQVGDYLGRNHGRIVGITETEIQVIEIVKSGTERWVERPRTLALKEV